MTVTVIDLASAALEWVHLQKDRSVKYDQMTLRQIAVLGIVSTEGPIDFGALSTRLGLTKPVATRAVKTLGVLGLVQQATNRDDRRRRVVSIRAAGKKFRESLCLANAAQSADPPRNQRLPSCPGTA